MQLQAPALNGIIHLLLHSVMLTDVCWKENHCCLHSHTSFEFHALMTTRLEPFSLPHHNHLLYMCTSCLLCTFKVGADRHAVCQANTPCIRCKPAFTFCCQGNQPL